MNCTWWKDSAAPTPCLSGTHGKARLLDKNSQVYLFRFLFPTLCLCSNSPSDRQSWTHLSPSLCQEDGNAITPTPKDWNPNEWKTKEAMLKIEQRGREPPQKVFCLPIRPSALLGRSMDSVTQNKRSPALTLRCWLCSCIELFIAFRPNNTHLTPMSLPSI